MSNPVGRPSLYTPEIVEAAATYVDGGYEAAGDAVPTVAGLACELGLNRTTCYEWAADPEKVEFSNILTRLMQTQERKLVNSGLRGDFNPPITKMMLTKHGYSDRVEQNNTHSAPGGGPVETVTKIELVPLRGDSEG